MILLAAMPFGTVAAQIKDSDERVPCKNFKEVLAYFDRLGYTPQA